MARVNSGNNNGTQPLTQAAKLLASTFSTGFVNMGTVASTESFGSIYGQGVTATEEDTSQKLVSSLVHILSNINSDKKSGDVSQEAVQLGWGQKPTQAQLDAVHVIAGALVDPKRYNAMAKNTAVSKESSDPNVTIHVVGESTNPSLAYTHEPSIGVEAFDDRELEKMRGLNLMFAFSAAIQDEFGEAFFRTVTLTPDNAGLELSLRRTMVQHEVRHAVSGEPVDFQWKNLLDAVTDTSIVLTTSTIITPNYNDQSAAMFTTEVKPHDVIANDGAKIKTAPLKPGVKIGLLGLGQNEKTNGQADQTDSLDHDLKVTKVYLKFTNADGESVVAFDTAMLARSNFVRGDGTQGLDRRVNLNFDTIDLRLTKETLDVDSAKPKALSMFDEQLYQDLTIRVEGSFNGQANLQVGNVMVHGGGLQLHSLQKFDEEKRLLTLTDTQTQNDITKRLGKIEFVGYDLLARRSNLNRRQLGLLINSLEERVRYVVPLSPPISVQTPITDTASQTDLAGPLHAQRLINSISAVTKLFEVRDTLRTVGATIESARSSEPVAEIEGFARLMVRPILVEENLDIASIVTSVSSANRTQDVQAAIVNKLRYMTTVMYTESRFQPALDSLNGATSERPDLILGTDPTIASYITVQGDWRTFIGFNVKVVVSYDLRMRGKIFGSFVRQNVNNIDVMSFGCMAYVPELITKAQYPVNGALTEVTQVQNRTLHVCTLPILLALNVTGLEKAAAEQIDFSVTIN